MNHIMKLIGKCECCSKKSEIKFDFPMELSYDLCGCETKENCHRWHSFMITEKEFIEQFYPELKYKVKP